LDLNGNGIETYGAATSDVLFDHDGDGRKTLTGWIDSDDGLLVLDRNGDGVINDGGELFGDSTLKYDGSGKCANGFEALAQEDTSGDGVINNLDDNWDYLRVWRDLNQDGLTDDDELFTLEELDITSLNLGYTANNQNLANGNHLFGTGSFTTEDDQTHAMADVFFNQRPIFSEFVDALEVPEDIQANLPNLGGTGALRELWEACVQSDDLKDILTRFSAAATRAEQLPLVDTLLTAWADTSCDIIY
jgi:hypothetical protein